MNIKYIKTQIPKDYLKVNDIKEKKKIKQLHSVDDKYVKLHKISDDEILILRNYYNIAEIYNTKRNEITDTVTFNDENMKFIDYSSITLNDGRVLIYGGYSKKSKYSDSALIFSPKDKSYKKIGNMHYSSKDTKPVLLKNGHVLILHNNIYSLEPKTVSDKDLYFEVFNPVTETFYLTDKIPSVKVHGRYNYHTLENGDILIMQEGKASFIYNVNKNSFEENKNYNLPYTDGKLVLLDSNNILYLSEGFIYKIDENKKIPIKSKIKGNLSRANAILLNNGNVFITDVPKYEISYKNKPLSLAKDYMEYLKILSNKYTVYIYDRKQNCYRKIYFSVSPLTNGNLLKTENGSIIFLSSKNCLYEYTYKNQ